MEKKSVLIAFIILALLAIGGAGGSIYFYSQYRTLDNRAKNPDNQAKEILAKVGKLIELPTGEEPTIATVQDAEKIRSQPFFAKAQNGYRVILFTNARMAILYDEQANKLINIGTINVGDRQATPSSEAVEPAGAVESAVTEPGSETGNSIPVAP